MQKSFIEDFFEKMNEKLFFVLVILVQLVFIFQGLDFADTGFAAVFYQRIFSDPSTVTFNFMFWLTGIIGGAWLKLFPGLGLLGIRIAGVICTTFTFGISYNLLKKYLQTGSLRLSLFLIILFLGTGIREFNYDDLTALLFMCAAWFLFTGLTREKNVRLFIAGMFIAANMFARTPNVLGMILILAIWFSGYLNRIQVKRIVEHSLLFIGGFVVMSLGLFLLMTSIHQDIFFIKSMEFVRQMSQNPEDNHSLLLMLKLYVSHYGGGLAISIAVFAALWSFAVAWRRLKLEITWLRPFWPVLKYGILIMLAVFCVYRAHKHPDFWLDLFSFYAGTSLIVGFLLVTGRQPRDMRILALIGCIMLLILPLGSAYILITVGKYAMWIILPIAVDYLLNIRAVSNSVVITENFRHSYVQVIDVVQMTSLRNACIFLTLIYILSVSYFYPYFDLSDRMKMRYSVNNEKVRWIYTTQARARVINELLAESAKYVNPNDYVLAFDNLPLYYYLTDTRPYMHNSWVWLYNDIVFKNELDNSLQETHICPVVIIQKRNSLDNNWPDNHDEDFRFRQKPREYLYAFLKEYQYREVWENDFFRMYIPAVKNLPLSAAVSLSSN
jgi:hypothetical protein